MTYPTKRSQTLAPGGAFSVAFRPLRAGPVTVTAVGTLSGAASQAAPLQLKLEVFRPTLSVAAVSQTGTQATGSNQVAVAADVPAAAADLSGNWTARVTNTGSTPTACTLTARFQVVPGNLGRIDHIVVLMMENRSFDHMLGYLSLEGGRPDIVGLTGAEVNRDRDGNAYGVHRLDSTVFAPPDPGHGWGDVDEQLGPGAGAQNAGFVTNFQKAIDAPSTSHGVLGISAGGLFEGAFVPGQPGQISIQAVVVDIPSNLHSPDGLVGRVSLFPPNSTTPLASSQTVLGSALLTLNYTATADDLTTYGNWRYKISNHTDTDLSIKVAVTFVPHAVSVLNDQTFIDQEDAHVFSFRPGGLGPISLQTTLGPHPSPLTSETGQLGIARFFLPGASQPIAQAAVKLGGSALGLTHVPNAAQLAIPGAWRCSIYNATRQGMVFNSTLTFTAPPPPPDAIMGYCSAAQVPMHDFLARNFVVCNKWYASLPTDTWPNRLYAMAGGSNGLTTTPSGSDVLSNPPGYALKSIFEVLQENSVDWTVFFGNVPMPLVFRSLAQDSRYTARMRTMDEFFDRARTDLLPAVSWIDPSFSDVKYDPMTNDDHPPGHITPGQQLLKNVFDALAKSPAWSRTLLLLTYDEHGGFYDHVTPPGTPTMSGGQPAPGGPADDNPALARYGVRVPAFVVSPWVQPGSVSNTVYDHTTLLATILRRFCVRADGSVPSMGARTDKANDVSALLTAPVAVAPPISPTIPGVVLASPPAAPRPDAFGFVLRKALFAF